MKKFLCAIFFSASLTFSYGQNAPIDGLIRYYPFSGNVADSSGNAQNGTVYGATLTTDRKGKPNSAFYFNGLDNYISIPVEELQNPNFTFSFWTKFPEIPNDKIFKTMISIGGERGDHAIGVCDGCPGGFGFGFVSYPDISYSSDVLPSGDTWYFVVGTREDRNVKLYINGKIIGGGGGSYTVYGSPISAFIGSRFNGSEFFKGSLDEVKIYNRAVNADEIASLYSIDTTSKDSSSNQTVTAVSMIKDQSLVHVYPNPSADENLHIILNQVHQDAQIFIMNSLGEQLTEINASNWTEYNLNISAYPHGVLHLKFQSAEKTEVCKIIHQ